MVAQMRVVGYNVATEPLDWGSALIKVVTPPGERRLSWSVAVADSGFACVPRLDRGMRNANKLVVCRVVVFSTETRSHSPADEVGLPASASSN
jgi:hypothetical protein